MRVTPSNSREYFQVTFRSLLMKIPLFKRDFLTTAFTDRYLYRFGKLVIVNISEIGVILYEALINVKCYFNHKTQGKNTKLPAANHKKRDWC